MPKPLTRTRATLRRMGPLTREAQAIQNELIRLARRLDRFQAVLAEADGSYAVEKQERRRRAALAGQDAERALLLEENTKAYQRLVGLK